MGANTVVLWEPEGNRVAPIIYYSSIYDDYIDLLVVEKITLDYDENGGKRIRIIGNNVNFSDHGAIMARVGAIVVGSMWYGDPFVRMPKIYAMVAGYVAENERLKWETSAGAIVIENMKRIENPCGRFEVEIMECVMRYYADLLNMGVDIEGAKKVHHDPGDEFERRIVALMLASIKEKLAAVL